MTAHVFTMQIQPYPHHHPASTVGWNPSPDDHKQAMRNHGQTLHRLNERGGMAWCEMAAILEHRPHHDMHWEKAMAVVGDVLQRRRAVTK